MGLKKIVFVIVEGPSDDEALELLLTRMYDKNRVFVYIVHGDITVDLDPLKDSNVLNRVGNAIKSYAAANHFSKNHFQNIVHIVDMDGAYIPDEAVVFDKECKKAFYTLTEIKTGHVEAIRKRNMGKSKALDKLSSAQKVWGVPYQVYYMSCNLDHVLYGKLNLSDEEKEQYAHSFAREYGHNLEEFKAYITDPNISVGEDYVESWKFIKQDKHSLERYTNFGICVKNAEKA